MEEIKQLLEITNSLRKQYGKAFSLDGKLVGDIGEVLVAEKYGLDLLPENTQIHDAIEKGTGRKVQIKASFKNNCYFPAKHTPDYFISVNIKDNGEIDELFSGPGEFLRKNYVEKRGLKVHNNQYNFSKGVLSQLNEEVHENEKIKEKN